MEAKISYIGKQCTMAIKGRIDATTINQFMDLGNEIDPNIEKIVFDFKELQYISSSGFRLLLAIKKSDAHIDVEIINASSEVYRMFEVTGFDAIFDIKRI